MNGIRSLFIVVTCLAAFGVQAQWQWIDKDGRKVFSDRGPPSDIPAKNILKQPGAATRGMDAMVNAAPAKPASAAGESADVETPKLGAEDKDLAARKKQAEAAEAAKTKAEDDRRAKIKAENCERAKGSKTVMDSGIRVSQTNAQGERVVLDDAGRAAELKRIQVALDANCK